MMKKLLRHRPLLLVVGVVALLILTMAGLFTMPAVAAFGAFATLIFGIAAQQSLGNIFAGILIGLTDPFAIGDEIRVKIENDITEGTVKVVGIVYTQVETKDDKPIAFIPNAEAITHVVFVKKAEDRAALTGLVSKVKEEVVRRA